MSRVIAVWSASRKEAADGVGLAQALGAADDAWAAGLGENTALDITALCAARMLAAEAGVAGRLNQRAAAV